LKILTQSVNVPSTARNRAITEQRPLDRVVDSDDFFLSGRIKGLLQFMDNADFVADDMWHVQPICLAALAPVPNALYCATRLAKEKAPA
jgi:hypothetical protein